MSPTVMALNSLPIRSQVSQMLSLQLSNDNAFVLGFLRPFSVELSNFSMRWGVLLNTSWGVLYSLEGSQPPNSEGTLLLSRSWVLIPAVSFAHWEDNRATRKTQTPQSRDGSWGLCISPSFWEALGVLRSACQGACLCSVFAERAQFICNHPLRYSNKQVA